MLYVIGLCVVILMAAVGLGFVIFVHELGHFIVAKLCGVKCEKFYLGFDIAGLKLCKFRWGETEYGIGILPLGGYVKMLGQEDNPARLREEMERAKQKGENNEEPSVEHPACSDQHSPPPETVSPSPLSSPPSPLFDPRSFLAQSVPKRMAIISAGVVMNVIFAFVMAVVAFSLGVEQWPCVIGEVVPGDPAWQADLRTGDEILEIAGKKTKQFRDLPAAISLGDIDPEKGVPLLVRRPGVEQPLTITVKPDRSRGLFLIGVTPGAKTTRLLEDRKTWLIQHRNPVLPGSAADLAGAFCNGDNVVQIDDVPIQNYAQIAAQLAQKADQDITVTVDRAAEESGGTATNRTQRVSVAVARNPMRRLGLVMKMGPIMAVQAGSPAAAGIAPGDTICKIDGKAVEDPMILPDQLRHRAGEVVELTIRRKSSNALEVVPIRLRKPTGFSSLDIYDSPVDIAALGVAYRVFNRVESVIEGSPAAMAGLRAEDTVVKAKLIPPESEVLRSLEVEQSQVSLPFSDKDRNWPALINALQNTLPGTTVELTIFRHRSEQTVKLEPVEAPDWFNPDRGLQFEPTTFLAKPESIGEACAMGGQETLDSLTIVFRSLKKISTNQVSPRKMMGPVGIIKITLQAADQGPAMLLLFLTLLSVNLALVNFLPIPVLDGGHMMFLIYEGIRGKPADERVQVVLTYIGLGLILALMIWALGLDFGLISRW